MDGNQNEILLCNRACLWEIMKSLDVFKKLMYFLSYAKRLETQLIPLGTIHGK